MSGHSLPMTTRLHRALQSKTVKARVSTCEGLCAHPTIRVASVHLRGNETQCWGLCARLWRETVFQKIRMKKQGAGTGRLGRSPNLSAALLTASQRIFQRICVRQNAPGKGRAEGSKKEQDKLEPHLPAVRSVTFESRRDKPLKAAQRLPGGAEAHPLGWGKHRVRLYAVRTRRGYAPAPPTPEGV